MSYSIIYDKQFIKVSDNQFIPMVLSGCSNLYEFNGTKERRVRSWFPMRLENKIILSREEILKRGIVTEEELYFIYSKSKQFHGL